MQFRTKVTSGFQQPDIEHNSDSVYVRYNFVKTEVPATETEPARVVYTYDEIFMSEDEYNDIRVGRFSGEWTDVLRSIERAYLYDFADKMIMKFSTDAEDEAKRKLWVDYKAAVRATQDLPGYPVNVTYPDLPE